MADVFISYKSQDRALVRTLVRALQGRGFTVWWDNRLEWGENWTNCIKRALDGATCVVVVWTPRSVTSRGTYRSNVVLAEATNAFGRDVLLPVRVGQLDERPFPHNVLQEEDLTIWAGNADDTTFEKVAARLETLCGPRTLPEANELVAWLKAEEANNSEAFRQFARDFPTSRFARDAEPRAAECDIRAADTALAREAATGIVGRFAREARKPEFTVPLGLKRITNEVNPYSWPVLFETLGDGAKVVLQAAPGGGKSTALLDLAEAYSDQGGDSIGVYLRLKDLFNQNDDVLTHIERLESSRLISEAAWHQLVQSGATAIFCDGWNELNAIERDKVGSILDLFALSYPLAGLMVGTRPTAPPPLRGNHLLVSLQPLTRAQIREIVRDRLGPNAEAALAELRGSDTLLELVRTPFFLAAFCVTRAAGSQPTTRESLIAGMLEAMAAKPEHARALRETLRLHHTKYLRALAVEMMKEEIAELEIDKARVIVNRVSTELVGAGIETEHLQADLVLGTLRDHHCLIERSSGGALGYQFQHQLINEWYAAEHVRRLAALALRDDEALRALEEILNRRAWTEALLFAAERPTGEDGHNATAHMILRAIGIDPDLAAEMIAVALRRTLGALAACGHVDALPALLRLKDHAANNHESAEWSEALADIKTPEAADALFSYLLEDQKSRSWHSDRNLSQAVASIAESAPALRKRILDVAARGDQQALKAVSDIVRHIGGEELMTEVAALPATALNHLGGAISDALRELSVEDRPVEGVHQGYERGPRAIPKLRAQLFLRAATKDEASATCLRLLEVIDAWREGYGDPMDEDRHPEISSRLPWPPIAQSAWDAASRFRNVTTDNPAEAKAGNN